MTVKATKKECLANARVVKGTCKEIRCWTVVNLLVQVLKRSGIPMGRESSTRNLGSDCGQMLLEFAESGHPTFRATTPLSRGKSKGHGKLSIHFTADNPTKETIFRIIISVNQFSIHGAVATICEEFETHQDGSGEPDVLMGQSIVLSEIKAEVPLENNIPSHQNLLLQRHEERIKLLSQENKVSKFCMDAGFVHGC